MVNNIQQSLDLAFLALSDPTRRAIVARLTRGECTVGELGEPFPVSAPAISKHLRLLERAGLIERRRVGRTLRCRLNPASLDAALDWIATQRRFWDESFDRLAGVLSEAKKPENP